MKKLSVLVLFLFCLVFTFSSSAQSSSKNINKLFAGGAGTKMNPYQITTCQQLQNMNQDLAGNYVLNNNIDCTDTKNWNSGQGFEPIGSDDQNSFKGMFDGHSYKIMNLYIHRPNTDKVALFGDVNNPNSYISSVVITNANITGHNGSAALIGWNVNGKVDNVFATGLVQGNGAAIGGLIGQNSSSTVSNAYSKVQVRGGSYVGGLVGSNYKLISNSYATGSVTSNGPYIGGFIGSNWANIENCYSIGQVNAGNHAGGFAGYNDAKASIINSYWNIQTSGKTNSAGGEGKTTAQMGTVNKFV